MDTKTWPSWKRWLLLSSLLLCSCSVPAERDIGQQEHLDDELSALDPIAPEVPPDGPRPQPSPPEHSSVLGFSAGGQLVLFDSASGQRLDTTEASADEVDRDLAWDRLGRRALVYLAQPDEQAGEIHTVSVSTAPPGESALGELRHRAWVDGRARLWPAHHGIVVFEEGYGKRWKLLRDDGVATASVAAPRPASAWAELEAGGMWLNTLSYDGPGGLPALTTLSAWVDGEGIDPPVATCLGLEPLSTPPSARLAPLEQPWPGGGPAQSPQALLVDVRAGVPVVRLMGAGAEPATVTVPEAAPVERVEQISVLPGTYAGGRRALAALLSGPSRLLVLSFGPGLAEPAAAVLELPGLSRHNDLFFGRDLLAVSSDRLLVATDQGVWAVWLRAGPRGSWLDLDDSFAGAELRGPVAGPVGRLP